VGAAAAGGAAGRAARETGIARRAGRVEGEGGGLASFFPHGRRLLGEGVALVVVTAVGVLLVYHFFVHSIKNTRPLGGPNVEVTAGVNAAESEASFASRPSQPRFLFGATNQLLSYTSRNGGRTWQSDHAPAVRSFECIRGEPHVAAGASREYLAFLVQPTCGGSDVIAYLAFTSRGYRDHRWSAVTRVAPKVWKYGYDDAASLAIDRNTGQLYLSWTRGVGPKKAEIVFSTSTDSGKTWSPPKTIVPAGAEPHLSSLAVAPDGDVYVAGIDAPHGIWIVRSTDRGKTFTAPSAAAQLRANPSDGCAGQSSFAPLPNEETSCLGPAPTVVATKNRVMVVYDDVGANRTPDVYAVTFDRGLTRRSLVQVNPPDKGNAQQIFPAAAADPATGALWACWYDTTFDRLQHRVWYTCSASHDGRTWTPPERASAGPTQSADIFTDIRSATGFWPGVVADAGAAHAFWIGIDPTTFAQQVWTAALPEHAAFVTLQR
jgi:hypothetical protein